MREYGISKTVTLLDEAVQAIQRAAETSDEEAVHKMRVSIRRLQQALRLFRQYMKRDGIEYVKDRLRALMTPAGELRNRDIAVGLVDEAGGDTTQVFQQRIEYKQELDSVLKRYAKPELGSVWREKLGLDQV